MTRGRNNERLQDFSSISHTGGVCYPVILAFWVGQTLIRTGQGGNRGSKSFHMFQGESTAGEEAMAGADFYETINPIRMA